MIFFATFFCNILMSDLKFDGIVQEAISQFYGFIWNQFYAKFIIFPFMFIFPDLFFRERERESVCFVLFCEYQHMLSVKQFCCMYCSVCLLSHTQTLVLLSNAHSSFQLIFLILFSCRSLFFIWKNYTYTHQLPFTYQLPLQTTTRDT
jgi:hypothetical protein